MSRIIAAATFNGHPVTVVMGWDRPLGQCFLNLELSDEQNESESEEFDPLHELNMEVMFQPLSTEEVEGQLNACGVLLAPQALAELRADVANNAGNKIVEFSVDGQRTQIA